MAVSVTASRLGARTAAVRGQTLSVAAGVEILTINHGLLCTPDNVVPTLRSIRAVVSTGTPQLSVLTYGYSTVTLGLPLVNAGAVIADFDVVLEVFASISK